MIYTGRYLVTMGFLGVIFFLQGCDLFPDPQMSRVIIVSKASNLGNSAFSPNPVRVHLGGRVVWENNDVMEHAIIGDAARGPCVFKSGPIGYGEKYSQLFSKRVTCDYYCELHGRTMRGKVIVE